MPSLLYLAYGSNLLPARIRARVPSARLVGNVLLDGWSLRFHKRGQDGSAKCNLVGTRRTGDLSYGAVFAIAPRERIHLDAAEGLGAGYDLAWLNLADFGRVFFYVAAPTHISEGLRPFSWYRDLVAAGASHHGFPGDYVDRIRTVVATRDPDRERHLRNLALLAKNPRDRR